MRTLALVLGAALAAPALASPGLTLNGVPIDGVTGQRIENATVVIDERGDVHIQADGWVARGAASPALRSAAVSQPGVLSRRYFLVTQHAAPGTQFDLAVFVNSQWIREVRASEPRVVMEITRYLRPGPNRLVLAATKRQQEERASTSPDVALSVVVGEGSVGGDQVLIETPLVEARRTAAETEDRTEEYVLEAR
jgi:hypothetical protein